ncbi:betaine lipid synthase [Klebsormidium nitens]|uniref:Betaine lipid synthase n=1 Tax=Klebsormidium nitens TaxID=105231 RepID=A0A1Y1ITQ9_KLENI|nr:betaine lipid synthase [Klebsormidium nitens]|eukprot:GAQ92949.1 betaine lipid synthase [Klebsormidium nitens]
MAFGMEQVAGFAADMQCISSMWFRKIQGGTHKERLESFYGPQAHAYDRFRANFLHGRKGMLAACAARLRGASGLVWVDLGGGTAENVDLMAQYLDLAAFQRIYVVDICPSLCAVAREKVAARGWHNVEVVEADACTFRAPDAAQLITFSYSLTMIPPFMAAVDNAVAGLAPDGIVGVADFYTSAKYDTPNRQHPFARRWFWKAVFDCDGIDLSPERRHYLEHSMEPVYEYNSSGRIPYVPYLRAPYYIWVGRHKKLQVVNLTRFPVRATDDIECRRPKGFPPTFLYSLSWEDPREDAKVLDINPNDTVLTLTSGGCNALDIILQGARCVVGVDMNPAQSYLLELKRVAVIRLPFEDVWKIFGEGRHERFEELLQRELGPFLSQGALKFWRKKAYYFKDGMYYHGGMGRLVKAVKVLAKITRKEDWVDSLVNAPTVEQQHELWTATAGQWLMRAGVMARALGFLVTNRVTMWFCAGVCKSQMALIKNEDNIYSYIVRCLDNVAKYSNLRDSNYFYRLCLTGRFARHCCPRFLEEDCFARLKHELAAGERLLIRTDSFVSQLCARQYTKVILMDHVDWLDQPDIDTLAAALKAQVRPGGRVIWRSASKQPHYARAIEAAGFKVIRVRCSDQYMDRVNMYASFYVGIRHGGPAIKQLVQEEKLDKPLRFRGAPPAKQNGPTPVAAA